LIELDKGKGRGGAGQSFKGQGRWALSDMVRVYDLYGLVIGRLFGISTLSWGTK
jgi:hypothetical protein